MTFTVTGSSFLALQVRGLDRAGRFYETPIGLTRASSSPPGAIVFDTAPVAFAVRQASPGTNLESGQPGLGVALWLLTQGVQHLHDTLAGEGVRILTEPFDGPFGRTFVFADPEGYAVTANEGS